MKYSGPIVPGMKFYWEYLTKHHCLVEVTRVENVEGDDPRIWIISLARNVLQNANEITNYESRFREAVIAASEHPQPNVNRDFRWQQTYLFDGQRNHRVRIPCVCTKFGKASYHYHADGSNAKVWPVVLRPKWDQGKEGCQPWPGDLEPPIVEFTR